MDRRIFYTVISFLCLSGLVIGYLSIPSFDEISLIYLEKGDFATAYDRLNNSFLDQEDNVSVIMPLVYLHLQNADLDEAVKTFEKAVKRNPKSKDLWRALTKLYKETDRFEDYVRGLHEFYKLNPTRKIASDIVTYNHVLGNEERELEMLTEIYQKFQPSFDDYRNYAHLLAKKGDKDRIAGCLQRVGEDPRFLNTYIGFSDFFVKLALNFDFPKISHDLAYAYLQKNNSIESVTHFAHLMINYDHDEWVDGFIDLIPESEKKNTFDLYYTLMIHRKQFNQAYQFLKEEAIYGGLSKKYLNDLISFVSQFENESEVKVALFEKYSLREIQQETLMNIIEKATVKGETEVLAVINENLGEEYFVENPVFKYALNVASVEEFQLLNDNEKFFLASIYRLKGDHDTAKELLQMIDHFENVIGSKLPALAGMVIKYKLTDWALPKFEKLHQQLSFPAADGAWALIILDLGKREDVESWFDATPSIMEDVLAELHYVTQVHQMSLLGVKVASRLVQVNSKPIYKALYATSLARVGDDEIALRLFDEIKDRSIDVESEYLVTLGIAGKKNPEIHQQLLSQIDRFWEKKTFTKNQWRDIGYTMINDEALVPAERVFSHLAKGGGIKNPDVETLVGIWGEDLDTRQVAWIAEQVSVAPIEEKGVWLKHLLYSGHSPLVLEIASAELTPGYFEYQDNREAYFEAAIIEKDKDAILSNLPPLVESAETLEQLRKYQEYAEFTGDTQFALEVCLLTDERFDSDPETIKRIGNIYLSMGSYCNAYDYFSRVLDDDYSLLYNFGDTLRGLECFEVSDTYYWQALRIIAELEEPDLTAKSIEASAWYRLGYRYHAACLYKKILVDNPKEVFVKLDLGNIYMDLNLYCDAFKTIRDTQFDSDQLSYDEYVAVKLVQIRYLKQTYQLRRAQRTLNQLRNGQLIFAANADLALTLNQKRRATKFLCCASQEAPLNEDYPRALQDIWLENSTNAKVFWEHKTSRHNGIEKITRLLLTQPVNYPQTAFQFLAEWDDIDLSNVLNTDDGLTIPFKGDRYRFTAELKHSFCNGIEGRGFTVYAEDNFGGGAAINWSDYAGTNVIYFHYNKPEWELFQTLVDNGTSDRVELIRTFQWDYRCSLLFRGVYSRYNLEVLHNAASSSLLDATVHYELLSPNGRIGKCLFGKDAMLSADYTFEFEESIAQKGFTDLFGNEYFPISIADRATHRTTVFFQKLFNQFFEFRCFRGWTYNQKTGGKAKPNYGFEFLARMPRKFELRTNYEFLSSDGSETLSSDTTRYRLNFTYFY